MKDIIKISILTILTLVYTYFYYRADIVDLVSKTPENQTEKLNVVWIIADDMSPDLPCYGDSTIMTPNISRLAREGIVYENAFANVPVCAPARSALMTGMYPTSIGTQHMRTEHREYQAVPPAYVKIFTEKLRQKGYYCSQTKKLDYQFGTANTAWDEYQEYNQFFKVTKDWRGRKDGQAFFSIINIAACHESQVWINPLMRPKVNPENIDVFPFYPKHPVISEDIAKMYSNLIKTDEEVGQVLKKLEEDDLLDKTIIVFFGDHGRGMPRCKRWLYDSGIKVPLIIRFPNKENAGTRNKRLISFIDFAPSMLSLLGLDIPEHMQGKAFLGAKQTANPKYVFTTRDRMGTAEDKVRSVRSEDYKYIRNYEVDKPYTTAIQLRDRMPTMKVWRKLYAEGNLGDFAQYWFGEQKPKEELYDLKNDPNELNNLTEDSKYREILQNFRLVLEDWEKEYDVYDMSEEEMITQMWQQGEQPQTQTPTISKVKNEIIIASKTEQASIEYSLNNGSWKLYHEPIKVNSNTMKVKARALRYGYAMSETTTKTL